jgi:hypothetical protein
MDDVERSGSKHQKMKEEETKENQTDGSDGGRGEQFRGEIKSVLSYSKYFW